MDVENGNLSTDIGRGSIASSFVVIGRWICLCAFAAVTSSAPFARAEDIVYLKAVGSARPAAIRGQIVEYTGEAITVEPPSGGPRRYPAERILRIETPWTGPHLAARELLEKRDFAAAAERLTAANQAETRAWARRLILTELMRCREALGQPQQAGDLFLMIAQSDPTTAAFADAPLPWFADERITPAQAATWLSAADRPAAILLGASVRLTTADGAAVARQALAGLARHPDARIAALAEAQLWRGEIVRATESDARRWAARIEQMPESVRGGPYFVLGQAYERLGLADEAMLAYLRVPILFAGRPELSARALVAAGRVAARAGQPDEARRLLGEVAENYADMRPAAEARQILTTIANP
jgi:tetratricopeptide (TPR) repeat protein